MSNEHEPQTEVDDVNLLDLFEAKKKISPAKVKGLFRSIKWTFMLVLLGLYYALPWLRWERGEGAPDQAVMIDTLGRKFYFFFIELWPQEVYYFTGLLLIAGVGLFLATAMFGRVWCGYACPQTVWTDLFILVERWVEGDRNARIKLDKAPWSFGKIRKRLLKHILWILIGLCTGGALIFYFNDAPTLFFSMLQGEFSFTPTFWMLFLTASTYLMAGFAREQVCTYMCPYARFQGAMFDEDSLIVSYDEARGDPRGKKGDNLGDCVDCGRCVAVCPAGIDIRDGQQYRCINCGLCIDACNAVMEKLNRARGLIRYNTFNNTVPANAGLWGIIKHARLIRIRTIYYTAILCAAGGVMLFSLLTRPLVDLNVVRQRNPLFVTLTTGEIRNVYTVRIVNKTWDDHVYRFTLPDVKNVKLSTSRGLGGNNPTQLELPVKGGKVASYRVFVDRPWLSLDETSLPLTFHISNGQYEDAYDSVFVSPELP